MHTLVHLSPHVQSGILSDNIFTLPLGYDHSD